ncbi:hypothetical protein F4775DRAFT_589043 [Biscogniauxia sp. FL1348]|nr:hypothetical protein F4775DRAFT_589043 [Biscogniauxia sp. FL1348]
MIPSINSQATQVALLEWADSMLVLLPPERENELRVKKPEHLFDGAFFSILLEILDTGYNPERFQQSLAASVADEGARRRNLHIIHMGLIDFARRNCAKIEPLIKNIDFQALDREPTRTGMFEVNNPSQPVTGGSSRPFPDGALSQPTPVASRPVAKLCFQILVAFVCAACFREDDNSRYVTLVTGLNEKYQQSIFQILQEVEARLAQGIDIVETDMDASTNAANLDADLAQEAALAHLQREAEEAKRMAGGLRVRLDRLQDNYDELVRKHEELQDENEQLHKQIESEAGNFDRHRLQRQLKENESLIANLENERNFLVEEKERLLKDKGRLEAMSQKAESLIDENQELKSKNEELSKKANMADNLRKKLEALKPLEAELKTLQNDRIDLAKAYDELENARLRIETLKRESEAYATKMQGYEIDIANFRDQKLLLAAQNNELRLRVGDLEQRSQLDEAVVKDLQEKVMMLDPSAVTEDSPVARQTSLEDELSESTNTLSLGNLELQRLRAENAVLKSSIGTETEKGQLIQEIEDARASRQAIQDKYNDIFERYTVGQNQLDALIQNMGQSGLVQAIQACYELAPDTKWLMSDYFREEAYSNLRTQVLAEQTRTKQVERELEALKQQFSDSERALLEARGDCKAIVMEYVMDGHDANDADKVNAVGKSSLDALAELKKTDGMLAISLRAELDADRKKYKALKDESEALQKQLLTAFIEKDELRREAEQANRELQKAADGQNVSTDSVKQSEKMEKLRTRYKQLQQVRSISKSEETSEESGSSSDDDDDPDVVSVVIKRQSMWEAISPWLGVKKAQSEDGFYPYEVQENGSIGVPDRPVSPQFEQSELKNRELERTLKAVRAGSDADAQKAQADKVIKNLQRENAMIATAWYDMSSRLQSNHVVLQRRNDVPRSWLNKQRHLVNATPRR